MIGGRLAGIVSTAGAGFPQSLLYGFPPREKQEALFSLPEAIYDIDYPGHYMRRIKSLSLTIPCIASVRSAYTANGGKHTRQENDIRVSDGFGQFESIATSTAQNDSGLFSLNFDDERCLPFEGAGTTSSWRIQLNRDFRQFDYSTISDVIIQVRHTAREGGDMLRDLASSELKTTNLKAIAMAEGQNGLARLLRIRSEFPSQWYSLWNLAAVGVKQEISLDLTNVRFPFVFRQATIKIEKIQLFVFVARAFLQTHDARTLKLVLSEGSGPLTSSQPATFSLAPYSTKQGNRIFRASKDIGKPAGFWNISAAMQTGAKVDPAAIEDILIVCHYSISGL
ncbi:hypothetical protein BJY01DRAFT_242815 [Aspergillus pseudoustus]|uniref:Tc toxin complex TcA C-terminal TcB-binding domain-containing protein n=1 Tax=Aspergillus pseudoustus TaxID=1810923 RepID=A0ABR4KW40_9EURO